MPTPKNTNRRSRTPAASDPTLALAKQRHTLEYIHVDEITPYPFNPRDNEKAIPAVAASIRTFGFLVPCVVDDNNVLVAGHTRVEASKLLGLTDVPCIRASGLTQEQINAFRLIDNKVSEQAAWDHDMLAGEIGKLGDLGLQWVDFGWNQEEIDCLSETVAADCLNVAQLNRVAETEAANHQQRRAPQQARMVLGEIVFFIPINSYRNWADGIRALHNFDEEDIAADIKRRLGILE